MRTALGLRAHSGWAAVVAVAGTIDAPMVLDRRRIEIADPELRGSKQPYHAAKELALRDAEALVREVVDSSRKLAVAALADIVNALRVQGHEITGCGLLRGAGKPLPGLDRIVASHALIHAAEGELFRDVLVWAAHECLPAVSLVREQGIDAASVKQIDWLGKRIGPPWTQDQRYATLAALLALAEPGIG